MAKTTKEEILVTIIAQVESTREHYARVISCEPAIPDLDSELPATEINSENFEEGDMIIVTAMVVGENVYIQTIEKYDAPPPEVNSDEWQSVGGVWFSPLLLQGFNALGKIAREFGAANAVMQGPSGYGKTSSAEAWAKAHGYDYFRTNCPMVSSPEEWFGKWKAKDGTVYFQESTFTKKLRQGKTVIVLDEVNRAESWLHNSLMPILDYDRKTEVDGEMLEVGDNTLFILTMNEGAQFTGTFPLDAALRNRMDAYFMVDGLPASIEAKLLQERRKIDTETAKLIADLMYDLRHVLAQNDLESSFDVSTRSSLKLATYASIGVSLRTAAQLVLVNAAPEDVVKDVLDYVNRRLGVL